MGNSFPDFPFLFLLSYTLGRKALKVGTGHHSQTSLNMSHLSITNRDVDKHFLVNLDDDYAVEVDVAAKFAMVIMQICRRCG